MKKDKDYFEKLGEEVMNDSEARKAYVSSDFAQAHKCAVIAKSIKGMFLHQNPELKMGQVSGILCTLIVDLFEGHEEEFINHIRKAITIRDGVKLKQEDDMQSEAIEDAKEILAQESEELSQKVYNEQKELQAIDLTLKKVIKSKEPEDVKKLVTMLESYSGSVEVFKNINSKLSKYKTESKKIEVITNFIKTLK